MHPQTRSLRAHFQDAWGPGKSSQTIKTIAYWTFTFFVTFEMAAGGVWDLLRIDYVRFVMAHLGYPMYLLTILGVWKIPCAIVLFLPRFLRLKEWAYAGAIFDYTGAAASHFLAGDHPGKWVGPLVFAAFTLASWALRPAVRRLPPLAPATGIRAATWCVPLLIVAAMLLLSFLTLPKGAPSP